MNLIEAQKSNHYINYSSTKNFGVVSPRIFGNNLEHTRSCIFGGLSAQMLRNRKFVGNPSAMEGVANEWFCIGKRTFCTLGVPYTHHNSGHYHMKRALECNSQDILCCEDGAEAGIGQHGLYISSKKKYDFAIVAKSIYDIDITVQLTSHNGEHIYAQSCILVKGGNNWNRYETIFSPTADDNDADIKITFSEQKYLSIGCLSLMDRDNFRGMRKDVIDAMKQIGITVLRWPGGNFAGEYNWFDGLLPVDERAPFESYLHLETQPHTLGFDFHEINTDDFIALCREIGAEPFITINIAWNTPEENAAWVEYCNGDASTEYGKMRIERGYNEPYNVHLWSLGNEMGFGHMEGDNSAAGYSHIAMKNGLKMLEVCNDLTLCSSGHYFNGEDKEWISYSAKPLAAIASHISAHWYISRPRYYDLNEIRNMCQRCISGVETTRSKVRELKALIGEDLHISFDEWNLWWAWYRDSSIIDGIYTALMVHMLIEESMLGNIDIACHFEAVNEGAIKVTPYDVSLTASGKMLKLMKSHCNANLIYIDPLVCISEKDGITTVTLINPSDDTTTTFFADMYGKCVNQTVFIGKDLLPNSNFDEKHIDLVSNEENYEISVPPICVAFLQFKKL